jgi:two-component system, NtrC family, sensor kinase
MMTTLMRIFRDISVKRKLTLIIIGVMAAAFALSTVIAESYRYRSDHNGLQHHLSVLASAVGANCSAALVFDDKAAAAEILSALQFDRAITCAILTDARSKEVASFGNCVTSSAVDAPLNPKDDPFTGHIRVDQRILADGKTVGYLTIWGRTNEITARMANEAVVSMTAFLLGVLAVMMIFERMLRLLNAPLVELHDTFRKILRSRDYSLRATKHGDDELGDLVVAFNQIMEQVEERIPPVPADAQEPASPGADPAVPAPETASSPS